MKTLTSSRQPGSDLNARERSRTSFRLVRLGASFLPATLALFGTACGGTSLPDDGIGSTTTTTGTSTGTSTTGTGAGGTKTTGGAGGSGATTGATAGNGSATTGGSITTSGSGGFSGAGGNTGTGGFGAGGSSPAVDGGAGCTVGGKTYPNGATGIPADCNTCSCSGGQLACTLKACNVDQVCGGIAGLTCGKSQFCNFPTATNCGSGDQTGTCTAIPQVCPDIYSPVCGCDNKTYSNECDAKGHGVSVASSGECGKAPGKVCGGIAGVICGAGEYCVFPEAAKCGAGDQTGTCSKKPERCTEQYQPVCGCDGKTYGNSCSAANAGVTVASQGECSSPGKACGARAGNTCTANQYCAYVDGQYCGAADAESTCKARPQVCPTDYAPVCGCDGKTYGNTCAAARAGSGVNHSGPCTGSGRSCVVSGVTYPDGTGDIPAADGCNTCSCNDGSLGCTKKACPDKTCGGFAGFTCSASEYCAYTEGQHCGAADASSVCKPRPEVCPTVVTPVCGCDGKTYNNNCEAARAGTGVSSNAACAN